jgi:hypothetical protein
MAHHHYARSPYFQTQQSIRSSPNLEDCEHDHLDSKTPLLNISPLVSWECFSALDLARNRKTQIYPTVIATIHSERATKWDCEISFEKSLFANEANPGAGSKTREETVCPCCVSLNLLQMFGSKPRLCPRPLVVRNPAVCTRFLLRRSF